jgi:hypothetical protein
MTRNLELTARAWHVADIVYDYLPRPFGAAVEILVNSLGPPLTRSDRLTQLMVTSLGSTRALPADVCGALVRACCHCGYRLSSR